MKKIIIICVLSMPMILSAVPAFKAKQQFMQADGSTFSAKMKGDEWFNWMEDTDGNVVIYNKVSQNYEYGMIKKKDGVSTLSPSGVAVSTSVSKASKSVASKSTKIDKVDKIDKKELYKIWSEQKASKQYKPHK